MPRFPQQENKGDLNTASEAQTKSSHGLGELKWVHGGTHKN